MSNERIYIVEDERIISIDLQHRLEKLGYNVCGMATSGKEAIEGIRTALPDLILMDIMIEGDIDGIDVAIQIRKELNIPVLFLSAYTDEATLERAKEASPLGYILKPFKERELAAMLEMALYKNVADTIIREKEQLFSAILKSTTDAILVIGKKGEILFLNQEAEQILEITDAESKKYDISELFSLSDINTGESFQIPRLSGDLRVLRTRNLRLINRKMHCFVVEMTINQEVSDSNHSGETYIISFKDISRLHEMTDTIKYQTSHDTLTGFLNRNELVLRMNNTISKYMTQPLPVCSIFIDIDYFRIINDSCGTKAGDQLLREVASHIKQHMAASDYAARFGGDDFVLIHFAQSDEKNISDAENIAQSLLDEARMHPFCWNNKEYPITLSIGIVPFDRNFRTEHELIIAGTQTVACIHESGGNKYTVYVSEIQSDHDTRQISEWISSIHEALLHDGFRLFYQPIVPLVEGNSQPKLEILLRMVDEDGSLIQPTEFIPIAERYNIMPTVDRWVVKNSFKTYAKLRANGNALADSIFCINLSGASLADESIISFIFDCVDMYKVLPSRFCIEVTETNAILNLTSASRFIHILKKRGFSIALDDFGSGFSSFSYLKNLPVDYLKIDGCFIRNMDRDKVDYTMVQAINSMCQVLGLRTIGEFAENETIINKLREIGVDYAQGYGISRPMPLDEINNISSEDSATIDG